MMRSGAALGYFLLWFYKLQICPYIPMDDEWMQQRHLATIVTFDCPKQGIYLFGWAKLFLNAISISHRSHQRKVKRYQLSTCLHKNFTSQKMVMFRILWKNHDVPARCIRTWISDSSYPVQIGTAERFLKNVSERKDGGKVEYRRISRSKVISSILRMMEP